MRNICLSLIMVLSLRFFPEQAWASPISQFGPNGASSQGAHTHWSQAGQISGTNPTPHSWGSEAQTTNPIHARSQLNLDLSSTQQSMTVRHTFSSQPVTLQLGGNSISVSA